MPSCALWQIFCPFLVSGLVHERMRASLGYFTPHGRLGRGVLAVYLSPRPSRRLLLHFLEHLIIPVGQVFGSRSAPSYFSLLLDFRAEVASTVDLAKDGGPSEKLANEAILEPLPDHWDPVSCLTPACPNPLCPPLSDRKLLCFANATFVDDNGVTGYRSAIHAALHQRIRSAFLLFGYPEDDCRQSCLNANKWDPHLSHAMTHLGFIINSRDMTVTWPLEKRLELRQQILSILGRSSLCASDVWCTK